jgi:hypothetical protein
MDGDASVAGAASSLSPPRLTTMSPRITIPANTKKRTLPELFDCAGAFVVVALFVGAGVVEID